MSFSPTDYLDFSQTDHAEIFADVGDVWQVLPKIKEYVAAKVATVPVGRRLLGEVHPTAVVGPDVYLAPGAVVEANAVIKGPAWIGANTTVRSGAYLREHLLIGEGCTLGNSSEFKNCLLFNNCEVPHFNYVGDSVLGYKAHLGAGVVCSNVRLDRTAVRLRTPSGEVIDTGLRKFGAIVGDRTEVGCNSVLSPGSVLGRDSIVYPTTNWAGVLGERQIVKNKPPLDIVGRD